MTKERRLGRGLEALLSRAYDGGAPQDGPATLNVYEIDSNPFQPRRDFDDADLDSLSQSIREHGLLQPIAVRRVGERYQLVAGERRLRAAIKAGWSEVPAQVIEVDDRQTAELAIVENLQRKDLNPLEKAASFQRYLEQYGCTQEELASRIQIDRSTVANLIRLLELPEPVQQAVRAGQITAGHARALLPLGDEREQVEMCRRIQEESLSVRAVEALVQDNQHAAAEPTFQVVSADGETKRVATPRNEQLAALEQEFRHRLGTKVEIRRAAKGRGKIIVHFTSHEEFERLHRDVCGRDAGQQHFG